MEKKINWDIIIAEMAHRDGISPDEVRTAMEEALRNAYFSQDPASRQAWERIPSKSDLPTLEEFLDYAVDSVDKTRD